MDDVTRLLPLGSVVKVSGSDKELMIISRGVEVRNKEHLRRSYDYGMCLYPEGLVGDLVIYTNHEQINDILFEGYESSSSIAYAKAIDAIASEHRSEEGGANQEDVW